MIKKNKGLIILLGVIIILAAAYFVVTNINNNSDISSDAPDIIDIYNIESSDISSIKIESLEETYTLLYDESISIYEIPGAFIDENKANETKIGLSLISTSEIVSENTDDLNEYGLLKPSVSVVISGKDRIIKTLFIGDKSPVGNGYYAKTSDESKVFILSSYKYDYATYPSSYYRTTSFFQLDKNNVSDIILDVYGKHTVTFKENVVIDKDKPHNVFNKYQITTPFNWPAAADMVGKIIDSVTDLEVIEYASENTDNMAQFGFSPYVAKLTLVHDGGKQDTIYFGNNNKGIIYIRTDKDNRIYGISYEQFDYLESEAFSFVSDFAFLRNIMTVKHISYIHNDLSAEFSLNHIDDENVDVKKDGKLMSQNKFKEIYSELISITIDGVYNGVFPGKPFLSYTFNYNDLSSEKVELYKIDERRAALSVNGKCQFYVNLAELNSKLEIIDDILKNN